MRTSLSDFKRRLIETWLGIQQSVIDQAMDQWRVCLNTCMALSLKGSKLMMSCSTTVNNML